MSNDPNESYQNLIPGIKQWYQEKYGLAILWLSGTIVAYLSGIIPGIIIHGIYLVEYCQDDLKLIYRSYLNDYSQNNHHNLELAPLIKYLYFIPGIKQWQQGKNGLAIAWLLATFLGYVQGFLPGLVIHIVYLAEYCWSDIQNSLAISLDSPQSQSYYQLNPDNPEVTELADLELAEDFDQSNQLLLEGSDLFQDKIEPSAIPVNDFDIPQNNNQDTQHLLPSIISNNQLDLQSLEQDNLKITIDQVNLVNEIITNDQYSQPIKSLHKGKLLLIELTVINLGQNTNNLIISNFRVKNQKQQDFSVMTNFDISIYAKARGFTVNFVLLKPQESTQVLLVFDVTSESSHFTLQWLDQSLDLPENI